MNTNQNNGPWTMTKGELEGSVRHRLARDIMGKNFFGVEEWSTLYGVNFSKKQLQEVAEFPWSEDILNASCPFVKGKRIRKTHFAFLGLKTISGEFLTIIKWKKLHPVTDQPRFCSHAPDNWYAKEKFANEPTCGFRWYLMPLEIVPNFRNKTYRKQAAMLPAEYEVPFAVEEVSKVILHCKKNGIYLNSLKWGRCQDVTSNGRRVIVGNFDSWGLDVTDWVWLNGRNDHDVGLATSRKFSSTPLRTS